jgi:gliding motility-associated-like protein
VDSATITEPGILYTSGVTKNVSCFGKSDGSVEITAYGGTLPYSYIWSTQVTTQNIYNVSGNNYYVTVTDVNGCFVVSLYVLTEPQPLADAIVGTNVSCYGGNNGTATVNVNGGTVPYTFLWNDFSIAGTRAGLYAGKYVVLVTDSNGCNLFDSITITQPTQINIIGSVNDATCFGSSTGSIDITVTGGTPGYTYSWSNGTTNQDPVGLPAGATDVLVTDLSGCTATASYNVGQPDQIFLTMLRDKPSCYGSTNGSVSVVAIQGLPPYTYQWATVPVQTTATASDLSAGTYAVTVTDSKGCSVTGVDTLTQPSPIVLSTASKSAKCFNTASGQVVVTATGGHAPYVYNLNGIVQASDTFVGLLPGNYLVMATDLNGCDGVDTFHITSPSELSVTLSVTDQVILTGMKTQLVANATSTGAPITNYYWSPLTLDSASVFDFSGCGDSTNCSTPFIRPPYTATFTVTAMNSDSCSVSDTVTVYVKNEASSFIPTAFTPNNDGLNDRFNFDILGATTIDVTIFDRWGERIYHDGAQPNGISSSIGWDGTKGGKPVPEDSYVYQLKITYYDGTVKTRNGTVTVMR